MKAQRHSSANSPRLHPAAARDQQAAVAERGTCRLSLCLRWSLWAGVPCRYNNHWPCRQHWGEKSDKDSQIYTIRLVLWCVSRRWLMTGPSFTGRTETLRSSISSLSSSTVVVVKARRTRSDYVSPNDATKHIYIYILKKKQGTLKLLISFPSRCGDCRDVSEQRGPWPPQWDGGGPGWGQSSGLCITYCWSHMRSDAVVWQ